MDSRSERKWRERRNPHTDHRAAAKRDRDRLLYCNALRRLAGVTQVISPVEGDVVHNRLTHTLKVAQIARRLAERLQQESDDDLLRSVGDLDPEVAEAAALAHDLGHPPFGHIGEQELNRLLKDRNEEGYEGNAQSFRIVTKLAVRARDHAGLNLTRATLNATLKYPWLQSGHPETRKWGAYESEAWYFEWVREGSCDKERCIEAQIMDWADDVTYAVHDVDDFFRAGHIPLHLLMTRDDGECDECKRFLDATKARWEKSNPERIARWKDYVEAFDSIKVIMPIRGPYRGTKEERAVLNEMESELITRFINNPRIPEAFSGACPRLKVDDSVSAEVSILKALNWYYVIESPALKTQQFGLRKIVRDLFAVYADSPDEKLCPSWVAAELEENASPARRAADIVSSLSDSQAIRLHQRLMGLNPGSIRDWV